MTTSSNIEYFFLEYVPNILSGDSVVIAVIFIDSTGLNQGMCVMTCATDWQIKVRCLDANADIEMLGAMLTETRNRLLSKVECSDMIGDLEESFSNLVQISQRRKCPVASSRENLEAFARELLNGTSKKSRGSSKIRTLTCDAGF
jgi:Protein of unknown function (DUF3037)